MAKNSGYAVAAKHMWSARDLAEKAGVTQEFIMTLARRGEIGESFPFGIRYKKYLFTSLDIIRLKNRQALPKMQRNLRR